MGNSCSLADRPAKGAPTEGPAHPPVLRAGLGGVMYREGTMHTVSMRRGRNAATMIPYERRVVRLALDELRDDKTHVFSFRRSACAAAGLRVSVDRVLLKADPAQVVGFACAVARNETSLLCLPPARPEPFLVAPGAKLAVRGSRAAHGGGLLFFRCVAPASTPWVRAALAG